MLLRIRKLSSKKGLQKIHNKKKRIPLDIQTPETEKVAYICTPPKKNEKKTEQRHQNLRRYIGCLYKVGPLLYSYKWSYNPYKLPYIYICTMDLYVLFERCLLSTIIVLIIVTFPQKTTDGGQDALLVGRVHFFVFF